MSNEQTSDQIPVRSPARPGLEVKLAKPIKVPFQEKSKERRELINLLQQKIEPRQALRGVADGRLPIKKEGEIVKSPQEKLRKDLESLPVFDNLRTALGEEAEEFFSQRELVQTNAGTFYFDSHRTIPAGGVIYELQAATRNVDAAAFPELTFRPALLNDKPVYELSYRTGTNTRIVEVLSPWTTEGKRQAKILRTFYVNAETGKTIEVSKLLGNNAVQQFTDRMFSGDPSDRPPSRYAPEDDQMMIGVAPRDELDKPIHEAGHRYRREETVNNEDIAEGKLLLSGVKKADQYAQADLVRMSQAIFREEHEASKLEFIAIKVLHAKEILSDDDLQSAVKNRNQKLAKYREFITEKMPGVTISMEDFPELV